MSAITSNNGLYHSYSHIASGKRINSAADDAAGLAIAKKMQREETGLRVGAENAQAGIGVLNVADGALGGVTDYLQRIRELALRSMNGLNSAEDKQIYQNEIDQLKEGIQMTNSTLEALGIADLDVTSGDFSLDSIDNALKMVTSQRSNLGAYTNRLEHTYNYNTRASLEQLSSRSRLEDLDLPKAVSEKKKQEVLVGYRNFMQREQMNQKHFMMRMFQ